MVGWFNALWKMNYYSKAYNIFNMLYPCKNREFAILPKVRALRFNSIGSLKVLLELVHWENNKLKLYRSVAKLKEIPMFTFNLKDRSSETGPWFTNEFNNLVYEYDLFIDFDKDDESTIYNVLEEVKELIEMFDELELPYYVLFSGNKGFQVIIDGKYMPKPILKDNAIQPHKVIAEKIKEVFNFKYLDLRNNGVPNRLCKVPYSLCPTKENQDEMDMNVALPLNKEQIQNFKVDDMKLKNIICSSEVRLNKRYNLERFNNLDDEQKIKNVENSINL